MPSSARPLDGYTLKRGVGRGGFGEVYFATSDAGKEVALKLIRRNLDVEIRGVTQCLNLKHPNLIDLYDIRYDDLGDAWVVMEYVAGASLKDTIDRNPNGLIYLQDQVNMTAGIHFRFTRATVSGAVNVPMVGPRPWTIESMGYINYQF